MSDLRQVLVRSQTDFEFNLAVLSDPDQALASYTLSESERAAFTGERMELWNLIRGILLAENGDPSPLATSSGGIGRIISGHHDFFTVFQNWEDDSFGEIVNDPGVIAAVRAIRAAESLVQRIVAVNQLMERIG